MRKEITKKLEIEVRDTLGAAVPYRQGGSWKITIPKGVVEHYYAKGGRGMEIGKMTLVFVETDHGMLLRPLKDMTEEV